MVLLLLFYSPQDYKDKIRKRTLSFEMVDLFRAGLFQS
jgi:hypothetical protein